MIAAVILAAGSSRRMGRHKLTLPWHSSRTIIGHVVDVYRLAGAQPIVIVAAEEDDNLVNALAAQDVLRVSVPPGGEMLSSVKAGLSVLAGLEVEAAFLAPADHPLLDPATVSALIARWGAGVRPIVAPSIDGHRGHPVLVGRSVWPAIVSLGADRSLRDFLRDRADEIEYVVVRDKGVLRDIDTPRDYDEAIGEADVHRSSDEPPG